MTAEQIKAAHRRGLGSTTHALRDTGLVDSPYEIRNLLSSEIGDMVLRDNQMKTKTIKLRITKVRMWTACQAAKQQFKTESVTAGPSTISIDHEHFRFSFADNKKIHACAPSIEKSFKPFSITLTPY